LYITLLLLLGIIVSLTAVYIAYVVAQTSFFRKPLEAVLRYSGETIGRDKRSLRRIKKIKSDLERAKKRLMLLFFTHLAIFVAAYTLLITLVFILVPEKNMFLRIPVAIPLISFNEDSGYATNAVFIAFIGFMLPSYLFARIVKTVQKL